MEEIKNRAKGSLTSKNYPEAIQLYSKGIEIKPNDSILFANRSMCFLSMGKNDEALSDAEQSVHYDPSYAKGYFRKGSALVALKNYSSATEAFQRGLDLAPGDKSFLTQLQKLQTISHSSQSSVIEPTLSSSVRAAQPVTKSSHSAAASKVENDDEPSETGVFRGYKKTSDGRTTTFFNNELDDETKALIGDIAPKKIEVDIISQHAPSSSGESVWNKAGTWEERIHTPWATSRLKELLGGISFPISDSICGNGSIYLKNISLSGDAQVSLCDIISYMYRLQWQEEKSNISTISVEQRTGLWRCLLLMMPLERLH